MQKYFQGVSFNKIKITENGQEQDVVIAMTEDEAKDHSYQEYLRESTIEKTREQMRNFKKDEPKPGAREHLVELMREKSEYDRRKKESPNKKYY